MSVNGRRGIVTSIGVAAVVVVVVALGQCRHTKTLNLYDPVRVIC